jgi:hypothetical protein
MGGGVGDKRVRESSGSDWTDQSKVYSQWDTLRNPMEHWLKY